MKDFIRSHKQLSLVFLAMVIYLIWWGILEHHAEYPYHLIYSRVDDLIPFSEYFIIPYLLWFLYIPAVYLYLLFHDDTKKELLAYTVFLFAGMYIYLILNTVYPSIQLLRPVDFLRENIFTRMVELLYHSDTATNVFPSIHAYNSIGAYIAVRNNKSLSSRKWILYSSRMLSTLIILSTMFLKQHSFDDVLAAIVMSIVVSTLVYHFHFLNDTENESATSGRWS